MGHALADEADLNAAEVFGPLRQNRYTVRLNVPWRWLWVLSFACRSLDVAALYKLNISGIYTDRFKVFYFVNQEITSYVRFSPALSMRSRKPATCK